MLVALDGSGGRKVASQKDKESMFYCPYCSNKVHVRIALNRVPHFTHQKGQKCTPVSIKALRSRVAAERRAKRAMDVKAAEGQGQLFEPEEEKI